MVKKFIIFILIFLFIFEFTLPQNHVFADSSFTKDDFDQMDQNGSVTRTSNDGTTTTTKVQKIQTNKATKESGANFAVIGTILSILVLPIPLSIQAFLSLAIMPDKIAKAQFFTIEDLLLGRFELFNVDFMGVDAYSAEKDPVYVASETNRLIKKNVSGWFMSMRNFAIAALFAVLIAIAILMAISSVAADRAKYKNMLIHWFVSFVILMLLPYMMAAAFTVSEGCVSIIRNIAENSVTAPVQNESIEQTKGLNFEKTLVFGRVNIDGSGFDGILTKIQQGGSWEAFSLTIVYVVLAYYQVKFFFMYLKRMITVGFLMIISPLITITYSIDKAGDNQAQAFKTWLKEFMINVFIQPLHALLFVMFMYSVYSIMERAPILAIIFLAALSRGEQLFRTVFKIDRTTSLGHLGKRGKGR